MPKQTPLEFAAQIWRGLCNADYAVADVANLIAARDAEIAAEAARVERERCYALASGWLEQYVDRDIKYVSAREYASSAVADIAQAIREGARP